MHSLFSRSNPTPKKEKEKDKAATFSTRPSQHPRRNDPLSPPSTSKGARKPRQSANPVGEFGAFGGASRTLPNRPVHPLTPPLSPDESGGAPLLPTKYTFLPTRIPPHTPSDNSIDTFSYSTDEVTGLKSYGFLGGVGSRVTLSLGDAGRLIKDISKELMRRGLATPMLFSNQALELNQTRTRMLITTYLGLISGHSPRPRPSDAFMQDLKFAKEHELAWLLRWALSRISRIKEGVREFCHGILEWEAYEEWRGRERVAGFPTNAFPFLATILPAEVYEQVLSPLFYLLSRFAAHSHLSGLTPHALSSLFAPLLFDIPTSAPALIAHASFVRAASATEHLLLAYIRSTSTKGNLGLSDLPSRLKEWVSGYPAMLASDADLARGMPRRGARVIRCERATRTVRAYSRDLVVSAELWADDITQKWEAWDRVTWKARRGEISRPKFSAAWRRRMMVKETLPLPSSASSSSDLNRRTSYGRALAPGRRAKERQSGIEDAEEGRWGSLAGKEWSMFEEGGFDAHSLGSTGQGSTDIRKRLQFDLTESAKLSIAERRRTMEWSDFASPSGGFNRTDPLLDVSLTFSAPIESSITDWPKERDELRRRLHKSQKEATPFDHDTTPRVGVDAASSTGDSHSSPGARPDSQGRVYVEEAFVDCWADLMMGARWIDRQELTFREANWALIEYKAKPSRVDNPDVDPLVDPRTTKLYILYEERVPLEYQIAIADPKQPKKSGFGLFSPKSKNKRNTNTVHSDNVVTRLDENDFDRMLSHRGQTRKMTLTKSASDQPNSSVWHLSQDPLSSSSSPIKGKHSQSDRTSGISGGSDDAKMSESKGIFFGKGTKDKDKDKGIRRVRTDDSNRGKEKEKVKVKSKDKDKDKDKRKQREQETEFEIHSASGLSSGGTSPQDGRVVKDDEKWMDILVANGARRMDRQDASLPKGGRPGGIGLPRSPHPPTLPVGGGGAMITPPNQETSAEGEELTPRANASPERKRSIRRKAVPSDDEHDEDDLGGFEPASPISDHGDEEEIHFSPSADRDGDGPEILAPKPLTLRERDTIHNIVEQYRESDSGFEPIYDQDEESHLHERRSEERDYFSSRRSQDDIPELGAPLVEENEGGVEERELPAPRPIFDLTPGREPSPARYAHGEPLHFVGEEPEEEEY